MCPLQDDTYKRLIRARAFIDECYDLSLDLDQIAGQASFSTYHFIRLFRSAFDQTPHQYLIQRRIAKAKDLLASSELSITEVCFAVGFQSLGSFSTLFRRCVGHPPKVYRARTFSGIRFPRRYIPTCFMTMLGVPIPASRELRNFREASARVIR